LTVLLGYPCGFWSVTQCRNCQTQLEEVFCPNCGQKDVDLERPLVDLVGEVLRETLDIDGRAWRTLRTLVRHPGVLTSEYLAGRRRWYTPPLRLYLVISVTFFVLVAWLASQGVLLDPGQTREADAASQAQFMSDELPRLMFALLPIFALLIKIVFPGRLYFDHIIFSVHLHSAAYVVLALMLPLERIAGEHWLPLVAQVALLVYFLGYVVTSVRVVYSAGWLMASLKSLAILFGYMVLVSIVIETTSNFQILAD
jgi:Protein of unknown function (DUF3667)